MQINNINFSTNPQVSESVDYADYGIKFGDYNTEDGVIPVDRKSVV